MNLTMTVLPRIGGGKRKHLGSFGDEQLAAQSYNDAAINLFGQFARINNIGVNHEYQFIHRWP